MNNLPNQTEENKVKSHNLKAIISLISSIIFAMPFTIEMSHTFQGNTYEWFGSAYASSFQLLLIAFILLSLAYINRAKSIQINLRKNGMNVSLFRIITLTLPTKK